VSRLLPRFNRHAEAIEDARKVAKVVSESSGLDVSLTVARATLPGDMRRLRGIPCAARGVSSTSPGTNPVSALLRMEEERK
jgi:hypothetical protein